MRQPCGTLISLPRNFFEIMNMIGSLSVVLNMVNFVLTSAGKRDVTPQPIVKQLTRIPTEARLVSH